MSAGSELKPCWNCKSNHNEIQEYGVGPDLPYRWFVRCCLNCGWQPASGTTELRANKNWNDMFLIRENEESRPPAVGVPSDRVGLNSDKLYEWFILEGYQYYKQGWQVLSDKLCAKFSAPKAVKWPEEQKCPIHHLDRPRPDIGGCSCAEVKIANDMRQACIEASRKG